MPQLNPDTIEEVILVLGFTDAPHIVDQRLAQEYTSTTISQVHKLLAQLNHIDTLLNEALETSYVLGSRNAKLSYASHVKHLNSQGSSYLKELANHLGIYINYNKYSKSNKSSTVSYW
ncbi:hypothetical protein H6F88_31675 [Oculatella sp. FACHB-28]|uniref:hypothetical protein n=1 Tax=Oculatella sp. FACHB-28 TaxID=2692845 RepID=UPI0016868175|nr:hypothetical protein [Oculatella sp. FACHB-28]MBD2060503.1 hypothetical protein [Oculatella sp. FACHB-28]